MDGDEKLLKLLKTCATDYLIQYELNDVETYEAELERINASNAYDLFTRVYESMKSILRDRKMARLKRNFSEFRNADERLWKRGHALMTFACAEKLGWMKDLDLIPREKLAP